MPHGSARAVHETGKARHGEPRARGSRVGARRLALKHLRHVLEIGCLVAEQRLLQPSGHDAIPLLRARDEYLGSLHRKLVDL
jgi:hypothetical protein